MKKLITTLFLLLGLSTLLIANDTNPLKKNRKHKAKYESSKKYTVKSTKKMDKPSYLELNKKHNRKKVEPIFIKTSTKDKKVNWKSRNRKLK